MRTFKMASGGKALGLLTVKLFDPTVWLNFLMRMPRHLEPRRLGGTMYLSIR